MNTPPLRRDSAPAEPPATRAAPTRRSTAEATRHPPNGRVQAAPGRRQRPRGTLPTAEAGTAPRVSTSLPSMSFPIEPDALLRVAADFPGRKVLVLGDLMLDRYLWGDTDRISPEAPVPVVEAREETQRLGGAANVAQNIRALGGEPLLVGVCGEDLFGRELIRLLESLDISPIGLVPSRERRTTCKTRILARRQQMIRIDREDRHELPDGLLDAVIHQVERALDEVEACVISDYGKGVITARLLEVVLPAARARGVPVAVDPKETHFFRYLGVSTITPNQIEASAAFGRRIRDLDTLVQAGSALLERLDSDSVLITRGAEGMALFRPHEPVWSFPAVAHEVYDVTGAGDTVVSVFALALAAGAELAEAAAISNHAAGIVVQEVGTATPSTPDLVGSIERNPASWQPVPLSSLGNP